MEDKVRVWESYYQRHLSGETYKDIGVSVGRTGSAIRLSIGKYLRRLKTHKDIDICPGCGSALKKKPYKDNSGHIVKCSNKKCNFSDWVDYDYSSQLRLLSGKNLSLK